MLWYRFARDLLHLLTSHFFLLPLLSQFIFLLSFCFIGIPFIIQFKFHYNFTLYVHYIAVCSVARRCWSPPSWYVRFRSPIQQEPAGDWASSRRHRRGRSLSSIFITLNSLLSRSVAPFHSIWYVAGIPIQPTAISCIHHIQGIWCSYSYINLYVIFIYVKLQSVVGEPLLCVSVLLLLHFVCRLSWWMLRRWCFGARAPLWSLISISIFDVFHRSHMCIGNVMSSVQPYDICRWICWCVMSQVIEARSISHCIQQINGDRTLCQEFTCNIGIGKCIVNRDDSCRHRRLPPTISVFPDKIVKVVCGRKQITENENSSRCKNDTRRILNGQQNSSSASFRA